MGEQLNYARALLSDIEALEASADDAVRERLDAVRAELDRVKDEAVAEAKQLLASGESTMTATTLENGQTVPSTVHADVSALLGKLGADAPAPADVDHGTDPLAPSIVDPPLAANPANLVEGDGTDPVKTPPVVTPVQSNGVATVVAPSAPEGDLTPPAPVATVNVDGSTTTVQPASPVAPSADVPSAPSPGPKPSPGPDAPAAS